MRLAIVTLLTLISSTVIGIDFGTDWLKVSIIKPGGQIETVLNRESKRKTNNVLNIRNGIRTFGIEADTLGMRFPQWTFGGLKVLLGKKVNDDVVKEFLSVSSLDVIPSERGTVAFKHLEEKLELEEVVAMLLAHAKRQAEDYAGIKVTGAVITVPPHFNVFERRALVDAAEVAGLRVFGMINDETAGRIYNAKNNE